MAWTFQNGPDTATFEWIAADNLRQRFQPASKYSTFHLLGTDTVQINVYGTESSRMSGPIQCENTQVTLLLSTLLLKQGTLSDGTIDYTATLVSASLRETLSDPTRCEGTLEFILG